jgi:glycosyl transferase family 25
MTVHIFVINLPEDADRRRAIEGQLGRLGLSYEVLPAIKGAQLTPNERRRQYDEKWFVRNEGRPALPGELGCALSHLAAYRLVVARKIPYALILEDDAWLNPNLPQLLQAIEKKYHADGKEVFC